MKLHSIILLVLLFCTLSFATELEVVNAKYAVAECYTSTTIRAIDAVATCTSKYNVTAPDLSTHKATAEADRSILASATTIIDFDASWKTTLTHMSAANDAIKAANSSLVGTNLSIGLAKLCYSVEAAKITLQGAACVLNTSFSGIAKLAILGYYDGSIQGGDTILNNAKTGGLQTTKMEEALDYGKTLRPEIVTSLESRNSEQFTNVRLRYGRATIRFFSEYDTSLANWAEPLVRVSNNYNKEEILARLSMIRTYLASVDSSCPAIYSIQNSEFKTYETANKGCWENLKQVEIESKAVIALIRSGVPVTLGGEGSLHAEGAGNVSIFGNASLNATGSGDLYLRDFKGDATVVVDVPGVKQSDGSTKFAGFSNAQIRGSLLYVRISGTSLSVDVTGKGLARLQGNGTFSASPAFTTQGSYTEVN